MQLDTALSVLSPMFGLPLPVKSDPAAPDIGAEFERLIEFHKAAMSANETRAKQRNDEKAAKEASEKTEDRINEILALIGRLKASLSAKGGSDPGLEAEIAILQGELLVLMLMGS